MTGTESVMPRAKFLLQKLCLSVSGMAEPGGLGEGVVALSLFFKYNIETTMF